MSILVSSLIIAVFACWFYEANAVPYHNRLKPEIKDDNGQHGTEKDDNVSNISLLDSIDDTYQKEKFDNLNAKHDEISSDETNTADKTINYNYNYNDYYEDADENDDKLQTVEDDPEVADHVPKPLKTSVENKADKYQENHIVDHEIQDNSLPDNHDAHDNSASDGRDNSVSDIHDDSVSDAHDDSASDGHDDSVSDVHDNSVSGGHDDSVSDGHDDSASDGHDDSVSDDRESVPNDHKDATKNVEILSSEKSNEQLNDLREECTNGPQEENQHYTQSFRQDNISSVELEENFDVSNNPIKKKTSSVHDSENITLCWIETTTVKEDNKSSPPKRQVFREFTISFENSAPIPDEYLDCPRMEGEVLPGNPDALKKTSFNEIIDQDVKLSKVVNLTSKSIEGNLFVTEHKSIRCSTGTAVTKDVSEWFSDSNHPKKRVEIKVGPLKRNRKPDDTNLSKENDVLETKTPERSDSSEVLEAEIKEKPSGTSVTEADKISEEQSTPKSPDGSESDDLLATGIHKKPSVENSAEVTQDTSCSGKNCSLGSNITATSPEVGLDSAEILEVTGQPDKNENKPSFNSSEIITDCNDSFEVCDASEPVDDSKELLGSDSSQEPLDSEGSPEVKNVTEVLDNSGEKIHLPVSEAKNVSQLGTGDSVTDVNTEDSSVVDVTTEDSESMTKESSDDTEKKPSLDVGADKKPLKDNGKESSSDSGEDRQSLEHHDSTGINKNPKTELEDSDSKESDNAAEEEEEDKYSKLKPKTLRNVTESCEGPDCSSPEFSQPCEGDCSEKFGSSENSSEYPEKSSQDSSENSPSGDEDSSKVKPENDSGDSSPVTDSTPVKNNEETMDTTTIENDGIITSPGTVELKNGSSVNAEKTTKPRLALKIKLLLEQINGNKEKKPLVQLEKQLTLKEDVNDPENENLISKIRAFNNSANDLESIKNLLNCSELENLTDIYLDMNDEIKEELKKAHLQDTYDEIIPDDLDEEEISKNQRRRKRDVESPEVKKNTTVQIDDIRKCLPEIRSDLTTGLNQIFVKLSSKLKVSDEHGNDGKTTGPSIPEMTTIPGETTSETVVSRDKRSTADGNNNKEVHKWSKERIRKSADGSHLRSVTELTILEDHEGLRGSH